MLKTTYLYTKKSVKKIIVTENQIKNVISKIIKEQGSSVLSPIAQSIITASSNRGFGLGTDEEELLSALVQIKDIETYNKVNQELSSKRGETIESILNGEYEN
jgi:hypothetical protein